MPISTKTLCYLHPHLYHMADEQGWRCIQSHGLLSTTALLDLFCIDGEERIRIESMHRAECTTLTNAALGKAVIRDQKPIKESSLRDILTDDLAPADWYRILNSKVFFWTNEARIDQLLCAKAYRDRQHLVLEIETEALLERHLNAVTLCPYNSGATLFNAPPRGLATFQAPDSFPFEHWNKKRSRRACIVELAVEYAVPDVLDFVRSVDVRSCR